MIDSTLKNAKILIVDDQPSNVEILIELLDIEGYENVESTNDSREVIDLYKSYQPDLILLDLSMPHLSGYDLLEQLKLVETTHSFLPVIVLTADVNKEAKMKSLSIGANDFLTKPFDLKEVGLRIKNMLYISYLQQQLQFQNQELDTKVKERTLALENINKQLQIAKEKAEESNCLKTAFLNNVSHEIRTPLNGILGFGQLLSDVNLIPSERAKYLELLDESSIRLINTVTNFLDISQLQSNSQSVFKQSVVPEDAIEEIIGIFKVLNKKKSLNINFQTPIDTYNIKINTDKDLLHKILYYLVDNAIKFTSEGNVNIGFVKDGSNLLFFVNDTGIGISEQNTNRIFNEFVQGDSSSNRGYEGSGLGLSLAKGYVELLGGKMWVDSEFGKGATFYFSLPIGIMESQISNIFIDKTLSTNNGKSTILIAEDDAINYFLLERILKHDNLILLHAENGQQAVDMCKENESIQLVFMDLKMPVMDGIEATIEIMKFRKNLPIIALTAYTENEVRKQAMQAGCVDFITKPVSKEILFSKLKEFGVEV
jgi:two-component system sensor histidine kinase/response regulator